MPFDWRQLADLAPLIGSALKPGSPQAAAVMQGYLHAKQQKQQQQLQTQGAQRQDQLAQAQIHNLDADNARQDQALALQRLTSYRHDAQGIGDAINQHPETMLQPGTDPLSAQNNLVVQNLQAQQAYGVPSGTPQGPLPNMTQAVSEGKRRRAQKLIAEFDKEYGDQAKDAEGSTSPHQGEFAGQTFAQIRQMAGNDVPPAPKAPAKKAYQSKEMHRGGKRATVNFDPETGKYFDLAGAEATDIAPIPPASQGQPGELPPNVMRRVDAKSKGFDAQPVVKSTQKVAEAVSFVQSLDPNSTNPADDQAIIYAFAKAMDPDSVVREGEYATVQKYSQSWLQSFGFNAQRILSNSEFLTPQARANLRATILKKYQAAKAQYDNVRKSYASQIDKITGQIGSGEEWLVDYGGAFPAGSAPADSSRPSELPQGVTVKKRQQ